jgi:hypothetical protein
MSSTPAAIRNARVIEIHSHSDLPLSSTAPARATSVRAYHSGSWQLRRVVLPPHRREPRPCRA